MKRVVFFCIAVLFLGITLSTAKARQRVVIKNDAFAIITEEVEKKDSDQCPKIAIVIKNVGCVAAYKAMYGEVVLDEGQVDVSSHPKEIQLGDTKLRMSCQINGDIIVNTR